MKLVAVDCETYLISQGNLTPKIVCGSISEHPSVGHLLTPENWLETLGKLLRDPDTVLCGANIAFDFGCALAASALPPPKGVAVTFEDVWRAYEEERVFDVSIAATLNAIADGRMTDGELFRPDGTRIQSGRYSLQECVKEFLGRDDAKANDEWRLRYAELDGIPMEQWPPVARQYPIDDARNTYLVAEKELKECRNLGNQGAQAHAAFCAHLGAIWGLRTDPANVKVLVAEVERHLAEGEALQKSLGLLRAKVKSRPEELSLDTAKLAELVTAAYQGQPPTTPTGRVSAGRETLEDSGDPTLKKLAEVSKWEKLKTYLPTLVEASTGPLNVRVNPLLATGRASYDGLIQLMPRKGGVRECFVARPGRVFSSVDYAAIEMSTLAQVCLWSVGTSALAEAINNDKDVHSLFAATMLVQDYEDFYAHRKEPERAAKRQAAKAANFGFPGMMGAAKLVVAKRREGELVCRWHGGPDLHNKERVRDWNGQSLDAPTCVACLEYAEELRKDYLAMWPEVPRYWRWVQAQLAANDEVVQYVSERIRGGLRPAQAANTLFQGLAADGAKRAVVALTKEMYLDDSSPLFGSRLVVFSHDETILEVPEDRAHEAAHRQAEVMVASMREVVPDVLVKAEPALMKHWSKEATAVYEKGRLVPWTPERH